MESAGTYLGCTNLGKTSARYETDLCSYSTSHATTCQNKRLLSRLNAIYIAKMNVVFIFPIFPINKIEKTSVNRLIQLKQLKYPSGHKTLSMIKKLTNIYKTKITMLIKL